MSQVYLGLGSNQDDPITQIKQAICQLSSHSQLSVRRVSSLYRSAPWGVVDQAEFVNACVELKTDLSPEQLLQALQFIEKKHKRVRGLRWGPRTLDLDILLFDQLRLNSPELTIPHLYLIERDFVVYPLAEIAPNLILPNGLSIAEVMERCPRGQLEQISEVIL